MSTKRWPTSTSILRPDRPRVHRDVQGRHAGSGPDVAAVRRSSPASGCSRWCSRPGSVAPSRSADRRRCDLDHVHYRGRLAVAVLARAPDVRNEARAALPSDHAGHPVLPARRHRVRVVPLVPTTPACARQPNPLCVGHNRALCGLALVLGSAASSIANEYMPADTWPYAPDGWRGRLSIIGTSRGGTTSTRRDVLAIALTRYAHRQSQKASLANVKKSGGTAARRDESWTLVGRGR